MKKIITYGTYDLLHVGHINLLKRAKEYGDFLIVGLSTEKFNKIKGKKSILSYWQRKKILESIRYVDKVIPENNWRQKVKDVVKYKIDIFVMGSDWKNKFNFLEEYCKVVYLPRTKNVSTTIIKYKLK